VQEEPKKEEAKKEEAKKEAISTTSKPSVPKTSSNTGEKT